VFPDGTIKQLNVIDYQIPAYNFCMLDDVFMNSYFNGADEAPTIHTGMIIDWDGNILQ